MTDQIPATIFSILAFFLIIYSVAIGIIAPIHLVIGEPINPWVIWAAIPMGALGALFIWIVERLLDDV